MIYSIGNNNINVQLQQYKQRKQQIDRSLSILQSPPSGTLDFSYYRLKKEKKEIQERITKINKILYPDIIA